MHEAFSSKKLGGKTPSFWRIFAIVALTAVCVLGVLNACRNRYRTFDGGALILDSWTGNVYELEDKLIINDKTP